jgi:spore coat protein U-like protein
MAQLAFCRASLGFAVLLASGGVANAATLSAPMTATLNMPTMCAVSGSIANLDFGTGTADQTGAIQSVSATSSASMVCVSGTPYDIWLSSPNTTGGGQRRMKSSAGNYINYIVGAAGPGTDEYSRSQPTSTYYSNYGSVAIWNFYGTIPAQTGVPVGNYTDTLTFGIYY